MIILVRSRYNPRRGFILGFLTPEKMRGFFSVQGVKDSDHLKEVLVSRREFRLLIMKDNLTIPEKELCLTHIKNSFKQYAFEKGKDVEEMSKIYKFEIVGTSYKYESCPQPLVFAYNTKLDEIIYDGRGIFNGVRKEGSILDKESVR